MSTYSSCNDPGGFADELEVISSNPQCPTCGEKGIAECEYITPWGEIVSVACPTCDEKLNELIAIGALWQNDSRLEKWFPITAEELNKLREENKKLIEQMALLVMFLYSESANYEAESLGERMFLDFAEPAYELIKDKWKCERCGNSFQIDGTCKECLANKLDEYET